MTAAIWCKEHHPQKTIVYPMQDIVDEETGQNILQLYVQNYKQADLTLTGTVRKATLVNQSTKAVNPVPAPPPSNRRTSTATTINGSLNGRGSISHVKAEDGARETVSIPSADSEKKCTTCGIDVSPKWWPFPPVSHDKPAAIASIEPVDPGMANDSMTNGHAPNEESGHVALAAAALHQNTEKVSVATTEFQCHQCHWKKVRKDPTPPLPPPQVAQREPSRPPIPSSINAPPHGAEPAQTLPHYTWPQPPSYPANAPYNSWPRHSPTPQGVALVHQLNGNRSPHVNAGAPPVNGQSQHRQPSQNLPRSPHQNGHAPQIPNGYPPSPRRVGSSAHHMQNGTYASYASTRPSPQHLTNGGPPPRAPEHPFIQNNSPIQQRSSFGQSQGSPPTFRDPHSQNRDVGNPPNNTSRPNDGRVNGGASESPSLRNLLS
jgi:hypothetical protein